MNVAIILAGGVNISLRREGTGRRKSSGRGAFDIAQWMLEHPELDMRTLGDEPICLTFHLIERTYNRAPKAWRKAKATKASAQGLVRIKAGWLRTVQRDDPGYAAAQRELKTLEGILVSEEIPDGHWPSGDPIGPQPQFRLSASRELISPVKRKTRRDYEPPE